MFRGDDLVGRRFGASMAVAVIALMGLSACAPEPAADGGARGDGSSSASASASAEADADSSGSDESATAGEDAGADDEAGSDASSVGEGDRKANGAASGSSEGGWPQQGDPQDTSKSTTLPASFPVADFVVPDGARIDDAGERSASEWYLVLTAEDRAAADALWQSIVSASGFAESERSETGDGGVAATLTHGTLSVTALQIPQKNGSVLLSFDITAVGG
ncbi:hypothetical protein [Leucobacter sp. L43]|uniref:hypothetical protein n=1 Tax=Leucobacter sp. L43 TaxID=2798040 RepID=UPI0019074938|nr:hypothetical protein [Leucobacter sp. L43]